MEKDAEKGLAKVIAVCLIGMLLLLGVAIGLGLAVDLWSSEVIPQLKLTLAAIQGEAQACAILSETKRF